MDIPTFFLIAAVGFGVGALSGAFGIGGGGIIVPLLHLAFGLPMINAASTSLLTILPTAVSGAFQHLRQKTADLKSGLIMGISGAIVSVISSLYSDLLPEIAIILLTVAVITFSVSMMLRKIFFDSSKPVKRGRKTLLLPMVIGVVGGAIAGLVGVGGGFIIVPFGVAYLGYSMKQAAGTSLISISLIALPGIVAHAVLGHICWLYGLAVIIGTIPGAQLGARLIARLPEKPVRLAFAAVLVLCAVLLLIEPLTQ